MRYNDRNLRMLITVKIESRIEKVIRLIAQPFIPFSRYMFNIIS